MTNYIQRKLQGANAQSIQKNLNLQNVSDIPVVLPINSDVIHKFYLALLLSYSYIDLKVQENRELTSLRDFLLPILMNGQVRFKGE